MLSKFFGVASVVLATIFISPIKFRTKSIFAKVLTEKRATTQPEWDLQIVEYSFAFGKRLPRQMLKSWKKEILIIEFFYSFQMSNAKSFSPQKKHLGKFLIYKGKLFFL